MSASARTWPDVGPDYARPRLQWITRRARRLQRFYGVERRFAIYDAWTDYIAFVGRPSRPALRLIQGGRRV